MMSLLRTIEAAEQNLQLNRMSEIQNLNESSEPIDPDYDPNLTITGKGPISAEICTKIGGLNITLTRSYSSVLRTEAIKIKALDKDSHWVQGWLAPNKKDDKQGIFSGEAWKTIQENRERLIEMIVSETGEDSDQDSDPIGEEGKSNFSEKMNMHSSHTGKNKKLAKKVESCIQQKKVKSWGQTKRESEETSPKITKKLSRKPFLEHEMSM